MLSNTIQPAPDRKSNLQHSIRVIGIGSHHGADRVGWLACETLQAFFKSNALDWQLCRTPAQLPQLLQDCDAAVILDAIASNTPAGNIVSLSWPLHHDSCHSLCSSHAINVIEALQLASVLGQLPSRTWLLGITVASQHSSATTIVSQALPQLHDELMRIVAEVTAGNADP